MEDSSLTVDDLQDMARSSYADMLHDDERNHAYYMAIRANVTHLVRTAQQNPNGTNRFFRCCDIGTGSGLLSMMIVKTFRDLNYVDFHVTAFEIFQPMAACAKKVIEANGMSDKITVIAGRAEDYETDVKFDLLVAELLDTELIGEGCLLTYRYAVEKLCSPGCVFIPSRAFVFTQPYRLVNTDGDAYFGERNYIWQRHRSPVDRYSCPGLPVIDDMQISQVAKKHTLRALARPDVTFIFELGNLSSLKLNDYNEVRYCWEDSAGSIMIVMWWDIEMYDESLYRRYFNQAEDPYSFSFLSCAPEWQRPQHLERDLYIQQTYGRKVWREHWIQGIYHPRTERSYRGYPLVFAYHDSHSFWFSAEMGANLPLRPQTCHCDLHRILSRSELAFVNSVNFDKQLKHLKGGQEVAITLQLAVKDPEQGKQSSVPEHDRARYWAIIHTSVPHIVDIDFALQDDVSYAKVLQSFLKQPPATIVIDRFEIIYAQVCFENLNRIRMRVGQCQGFDLSHLDDMIEKAAHLIDDTTEPHHLIEYGFEGFQDQKAQRLVSISRDDVKRFQSAADCNFSRSLALNIPEVDRAELRKGLALIFWTDFYRPDGELFYSGRDCTGREDPVAMPLDSTTMDSTQKQLVHFLHDHPALENESCHSIALKIDVNVNGIQVTREIEPHCK